MVPCPPSHLIAHHAHPHRWDPCDGADAATYIVGVAFVAGHMLSMWESI